MTPQIGPNSGLDAGSSTPARPAAAGATLDITPARRRAIAVLALKGRARRAQTTDHTQATVASAVTGTLAEHGLAEEDTDTVNGRRVGYWRLTPAGRVLAVELGLLKEAG